MLLLTDATIYMASNALESGLPGLKRRTNVGSTELHTQHALKLGEDLLAGNGLARLVFLDNLGLFRDFLENE